jgi:Zn-dependent oligopeptidase
MHTAHSPKRVDLTIGKVADRLRKSIFSVGNTIDPAEAYRNFRGRDPKVEALMKKRGFSS